MKGAFLIHGWGNDQRVWYKYWRLDREAPMVDMLEANGYKVVILELPGMYLERDKDITWYGKYLGHIIREREEFEEVLIIGHSMGGIIGRTYLTGEEEEFQEGRDRVKMMISIGSPNMGTSVPHFDRISSFLTTIADFVLPWGNDMVKGEEHNYFMTTPCYRDIQLGSNYLLSLNQKVLPEHIESHVIWTNGDTVAEPQHTCVLPGAKNHLVDRVIVNHFNMCSRKEVVETVEAIINGNEEPYGLQDHPSPEGCPNEQGHLWLPDTSLVNREGLNVWECSNCGDRELSLALPVQLTGRNDKGRPALHRWNRVDRVYRYKFKCSRCSMKIWHPDLG